MKFADTSDNAIPTYCVEQDSIFAQSKTFEAITKDWIKQNNFSGSFGQSVLCPTKNGNTVALLGLGNKNSKRRSRFSLAAAAKSLPAGSYDIVNPEVVDNLEIEVLGWLINNYIFDKYKNKKANQAYLVQPKLIDSDHILKFVEAEALARNLINTPTSDMGPEDLASATKNLANKFDADYFEITGESLIKQNFPLIHAVGRASSQEPRLLEIKSGNTGPKVTLVGKGVCFDTGGLNIKPGRSMGLMKKDMGGAANVLALAFMILSTGMNIQLRVLIPAVENSISGNSFRPGDILTARNGSTVEINNTDAEGRLVLADTLSFASEDNPDLIISMATLTGAARVAVGADIAPFFTERNEVSDILKASGAQQNDPVWPLPFWDPYEKMIEPDTADLDNSPSGGYGGAITAALFLRRFVAKPNSYIHFDIYSWSDTSKPGLPKGGITQGPRAIFGALPKILDL
ncbi:leucyl aminopeptidase family protein [Rhodobacteraceae bacterium]|nr:leucyl aminopeptidase family protein [Paracoccaceae bacterium]